MNSIKIFIVFFATLFSFNLRTMEGLEQPKLGTTQVSIIDENKNDPLIIPENTQIHVFGSTPYFSENNRYFTVLKNHLEQLAGLPKSLKSTENTKKPLIKTLIKDKNALQAITQLSEEQKYDLFLNEGINKPKLEENVQTFLKQITGPNLKTKRSHYLLHIFLPKYFSDVAEEIKNKSLSALSIKLFLERSAVFYCDLYKKHSSSISPNLFIRLIIPKVEHFESLNSIENTVQESILSKLPLNMYKNVVFINQNPQEALELATQLNTRANLPTHEGIAAEKLIIFDDMMRETKTFAAYTLKRDKKYKELFKLFKASPLITQNLADFLHIKKD